MPIEKDLSHLPTKVEGLPPTSNPRFGPHLAAVWMDMFGDDEDRPMADDTARVRASWAGNCARRIGYELTTDIERSNPMTIADYWRLGIGKAVHEWWQQAMVHTFPDAEPEKKSLLLDGLFAGHGDLYIPELKVEIEAKTINGFGFKKAVGSRGPAEGPRHSALLQGALNAHAHGAEQLVILYLSLELLSPREREKINTDEIGRFVAEWVFDREVFEPLALAELERLQLIVADVDAGVMPERRIPDPEMNRDAIITNPSTGEWRVEAAGLILDTGKTWHCAYCPFQDQCVTDSEHGQ